jgi:hypothetical protein
VEKVDLKKEIAAYSARRGQFDIVEVPPLRYLMIDGSGDPNTADEYRAALETLYPVAYKLKFLSKRELDRDYVVMPLEALWWADDMTTFTTARNKSQWKWTLLNLVPEWISDDVLNRARQAAPDAPVLDRLRVETLAEGRCVQTLHVGTYDDEAPLLQKMHEQFIPQQGLRMTGRHHEIYFSDPRRTDPSKLKTLLRQPAATV